MTLDQLLAALKKCGFAIVNENENTFELSHPDLSYRIYVKRKVSVKRASTSRLVVIHPEYIERVDAIRAIPGLALGATPKQPIEDLYLHNSSMRSFPKRRSSGKKTIHYGIDVNVDSVDSLERLIDVLSIRENKSPADNITLNETEREALVKVRLNQGSYRRALLDYWQGCAVTGCELNEMLRASHIKPWRTSIPERLDPFNGLLLAAHLDLAFDQGLITFDDTGLICLSPELNQDVLQALGFHPAMRLRKITPKHNEYLAWHREHLFRK